MQITTSQAVSAQQALNGRASNTTDKELDRDAFLKLLTTQMQAQDPLNPMDNTQFVAQLSQFTSLERLESMSGSLDTLAMSTASNTSAQMVSFIGKELELERGAVTLERPSGAHTPAQVHLAEGAEQVTVSIKDEHGKIVRTLELGRREAGEVSVEWDGFDDDGGPLKAGEYTLSVEAVNDQSEAVTASLRTRRKVTGVSFTGGIPQLELEGETRPAGLGEVHEVTDPSSKR